MFIVCCNYSPTLDEVNYSYLSWNLILLDCVQFHAKSVSFTFKVKLSIIFYLKQNQLTLKVACCHLTVRPSDRRDMCVCVFVVPSHKALRSIPEVTFHLFKK